MRAVPIPDGTAERVGGQRVVIGEPDPTRDDVRPCEYVVTESKLYPGRPAFSALIALDEGEMAALVNGERLWLVLDGAEVPWRLGLESEGPG